MCVFAAGLSLATVTGCGGAEPFPEGNAAAPGNAPVLSNLRIDDVVTVGETLSALVQTADADGLKDISLRLKVVVGDTSTEMSDKLDGFPEGLYSFDITIPFLFSQPGEHKIDITAIDIDGNESNTLSATVTASE